MENFKYTMEAERNRSFRSAGIYSASFFLSYIQWILKMFPRFIKYANDRNALKFFHRSQKYETPKWCENTYGSFSQIQFTYSLQAFAFPPPYLCLKLQITYFMKCNTIWKIGPFYRNLETFCFVQVIFSLKICFYSNCLIFCII